MSAVGSTEIAAAGAPHGAVRATERDLPDWFQAKRGGRHRLVGWWVPAIMVGIPIAVIVLIVIYPTIWMLYHAFQSTDMMSLFSGDWRFVGFANFTNVLTSSRFHNSIGNLAIYLIFGACLQVVLGTAIALILYELVRTSWLRVVLLIVLVVPIMMPPAIAGVLWRFLLQAQNGAVNHLLLHLGVLQGAERVNWFSVDLALWSLVMADSWQWTALTLLIVYSGRVSLPPAVYEAAQVDGASRWQVLTRLTLPMLKEIIAIAFILRFMDAYKFVDKVYVMTSGGPAQASELPVYIAFQKGIREFQIGEAAGYAIVIFVGAALLITLFLKYLKRVMRHQGVTA